MRRGNAPLWSTTGRRLALGAIAVVLLAAASVAAFQHLFASFAPYDDEGYLLLSLRMYRQGHPLYEEIYSQYGPAYYALHGLVHTLSTWPVTHEMARWKTLFVWIVAAMLCGAFVGRETGMRSLGMAAFLASFFHLDRLGIEAAHPQDICLLALTGTLLLSTCLPTRGAKRGAGGRQVPPVGDTPHVLADFPRVRTAAVMVGMGLLTSAVAMTKINAGVVLFLGVSLALLAASPRNRGQRVLGLILLGAAMLLPWCFARYHALSLRGIQLPIVVSVAICLTSWISRRVIRQPLVPGGATALYAGSFAGGCSLFAVTALWRGTSLPSLVHGMFLQHSGFIDVFYEDPPIYLLAAPCAFLAIAVLAAALQGRPSTLRLVGLALAVLATGVFLRHLADTFTPLTHGANDRGQAALLVSLFTPFVGVVLLPYRNMARSKSPATLVELSTEEKGTDPFCAQHPAGRSGKRGLSPFPFVRTFAPGSTTAYDTPRSPELALARVLLCTVSALSPLVIYPIPGTQVAVGSLGLLLALLISVGDTLRNSDLLAERETVFRNGLLALLVALPLVTLICRDLAHSRQRAAKVPLGLPGAERLRLPRQFVHQTQWTVAQLHTYADTFVCLQNGHNSLYLWSDLDPPTGCNATLWQDLLTDDQQWRIIRELRSRRRTCVVVDKAEPPPKRTSGLLTRYLQNNYSPALRNGSIEIWLRPEDRARQPLPR